MGSTPERSGDFNSWLVGALWRIGWRVWVGWCMQRTLFSEPAGAGPRRRMVRRRFYGGREKASMISLHEGIC